MARFLDAIRRLFCKKPPQDGNRSSERNEMLFRKIEKTVNDEALYLNPVLSLDMLAEAVCSNRTYVTAALTSHGFTFPAYINGFRVQKALSLLADPASEPLDACRIADLSGFQSDRSMSYYLTKTFGVSFRILRDRARKINIHTL